MKYTKPPLTFGDQLALMKQRGLVVTDDGRALRWLKRVSYYRLSGYFLPFRVPNSDSFGDGTTFDDIVDLYKFDGRLRVLFHQATQRIEVAFRTSITYELAHTYGPFAHTDQDTYSKWFVNPVKFGVPAPFVELMEKLAREEKRARELFVKAYRQKYSSEQHLPIWMATELMSFGTLSMMFEGLKSVTKTKIAAEYQLAEKPFQNWMHVLSTIRNLAAHHSRLWNRQLGVQAMIPHGWVYKVPHADRTYCVAVMLQHLLGVIAPNAKWKQRFLALFDEHSGVDVSSMGFPKNWRDIDPWRATRPAVPVIALAAAQESQS